MISLYDFLSFTASVEANEKGICALEKCFDTDMRNHNICALINQADKIAFLLMGGTINQYEENVAFQDDFWLIIDEGKSEFTIVENEQEKNFVLNSWTDFYNYWKEKL